MAELVCVDPRVADQMWPHVKKLLQRAVDRCGDWSIDDLRRGILSGRYLIWMTWDGAIGAVAVSGIFDINERRVCQVIACAGSDDDWPSRLAPIEKFAKDQNCERMRISGRSGWQRVFRDYQVKYLTMEKTL